MKKRERIEALEKRVEDLTARLNAHEAWATGINDGLSKMGDMLEGHAAHEFSVGDGDPWSPLPNSKCGEVVSLSDANPATSDTAIIPPEAIAKANAPNDMRVVIETKDTPDGFQMNVRTHERGTGYPITESDESKRIAEAVASTPHTC